MSLINDPTRAFSPMMKVSAFEDIQRTKAKGSVTIPYDTTVMEAKFETILTGDKSLSKQGGNNNYEGAKSSELKVTFLLDDTTFANPVAFALPPAMIADNVDKTIKKLLDLCHTEQKLGEESGPYYLSLKPLDMPLLDSPGGEFKGRLQSMNIKTELVNILGDRIKAKVECVFKESLSPEELAKKPSSKATAANSMSVG